MYPSATFLSSHVNNPISIKVGAWVSKINSIWRAHGVLGLSIRVCIDRRTSNAVLRSGLADAAVVPLGLAQCHVKITRTYRAISPRFAINIEVKGVMHADVSLTEELCLRTSTLGTPKRNLRVPEALRKRDCRAMTTVPHAASIFTSLFTYSPWINIPPQRLLWKGNLAQVTEAQVGTEG